jgi:hypothetical protein
LQDKRLDSHGPYHRAALAGIVVVEGLVGILEVGSPVTKYQSAFLRKRKSKVRVKLGGAGLRGTYLMTLRTLRTVTGLLRRVVAALGRVTVLAYQFGCFSMIVVFFGGN